MSTARSAVAGKVREQADPLDRLDRLDRSGGAFPAPRRLTVVPPLPAPIRHAPARAPFVLLVCTLLAGGLLFLLLLNTVLAQNSFVLYDLEKRSGELADRESALQETLAREAAPERLAERAEALGMVPSRNPAFLRVGDGAVLGVPAPGEPAKKPAKEKAKKQAKKRSSGRTTEEARRAVAGDTSR